LDSRRDANRDTDFSLAARLVEQRLQPIRSLSD
jgi:hypothetical protein